MAKKKVVAEELKAPAVKGLLRDVPDPTVYLNGVLRFDDDHIIRVKYDPTSKAMVIDDVPQSLESSITLGEGGGGGITNPELTINVVNNSGGGIGVIKYDVNDSKLYRTYTNFQSNESGEAKTLVPVSIDENEDEVYMILYNDLTWATFSHSNAVNCTFDDDDEVMMVTDPTQPASFTMTVSSL